MSEKLIPLESFETGATVADSVAPGIAKPGDLIFSRLGGCTRPSGWKFALERPVAGAVLPAGKPVLFRGWVINPNAPVASIRVMRERDEKEIGRLETGRERARVATAHPEINHAATSGFEGQLALSQPGCYWIEVVQPDRVRIPIFRLSLSDPATKPAKLMFMHIAKTAGSSMNRFIADSIGADRCAFHLEIDKRWRDPSGLRQLGEKVAISGHVTYRMFAERLDLAEYVKVTMLRNPLDHLISHLAFIRRLADPSQRTRLNGHTPAIQAFVAKLAALDFTDYNSVRDLVANLQPFERVLVENCQTRYLSHVPPVRPVDKHALNVARGALHKFDILGFTETIDVFLDSVASRMGWPRPKTAPRENLHPERYGIDATNPAIRAALQPLIHFDSALYKYAQKVFVDGKTKPVRRQQERALAANAAREEARVRVSR